MELSASSLPSGSAFTLPLSAKFCVMMTRKTPRKQDRNPVIVRLPPIVISSKSVGGSPPFSDFEDMTIGGNLTITGLRSCFLGVIRVIITQNFALNGSVNADPDGNELADNSIAHNLNCNGNSPSPQIGDSGGGLNKVFGRANGQCA